MALLKAAFIDHSFKKKTRSSDFLKQMLRREYALFEFWDERWQGGPSVKIKDLNREDFAVLFFFQMLPPPRVFKKLKCQQFVWFPMYDQEAPAQPVSYLPYLRYNLKIVCFCRLLYARFQKLGFDCRYFQYFPKALPVKNTAREQIVFFWARTNEINWEIVKKILGKNKIKAVILKHTPDPGQKIALPSLRDRRRYNIRIINHWLSPPQYNQVLSLCNIFIAPRKAEGIGLAFLEAMARGMAVIAPNNPTMGEYIKHKQNGYLYEWHDPLALDLCDYKQVGARAHQYIQAGRKHWLQARKQFLGYLREPTGRFPRAMRVFKYFLYAPVSFVYTLKSSWHL